MRKHAFTCQSQFGQPCDCAEILARNTPAPLAGAPQAPDLHAIALSSLESAFVAGFICRAARDDDDPPDEDAFRAWEKTPKAYDILPLLRALPAGSSTEAGGLREAAENLLSALERSTGLRAEPDSPIGQWFWHVVGAAGKLRAALAAGPQYQGNDLEAMDAFIADVCQNGGQHAPDTDAWCEKHKALWARLRGRLRAQGDSKNGSKGADLVPCPFCKQSLEARGGYYTCHNKACSFPLGYSPVRAQGDSNNGSKGAGR